MAHGLRASMGGTFGHVLLDAGPPGPGKREADIRGPIGGRD